MKKIQLFILQNCPFCMQALKWQESLMDEHPEYRSIPIDIIDERVHPALADSYDYYYVPTYYVDGEKKHEGAATRNIIESVFDAAMS